MMSKWLFNKMEPNNLENTLLRNQTKLLDEGMMKLVQKCFAAMPFPFMIAVIVATMIVIMWGNGIAAKHF